jgi:YVTN family beta-propeller protein
MPTITLLNLTMSRDTAGVVAAKVEYRLQFSDTEIRGNIAFAERVALIRRYGETDIYAAGTTSPTITTGPSDPRDRVVAILTDETMHVDDLGATIEAPTVARTFIHVLTLSELGVLLEIGREHPYALVSASPIEFRSDVQVAPVEIDVGDLLPSPSFEVGGEPVSLAVDGVYLWVATSEGSLLKYDQERGLIGRFEIGGTPQSITFDGEKLWVAVRDGTVKHFDREGALLRSFPSGSDNPVSIGAGMLDVWIGHVGGNLSAFNRDGTPHAVAFRGSGIPWSIGGTDGYGGYLVLVACFGTNRVEGHVQQVDSPISSYTVGSGPWDLAYANGLAWVTNHGSSSVSIIDVNTNTVESFKIGSQPKGIAIGAGAVWIVSSGSNELFQLDPADRTVVRTYAVGQEPDRVVFDRDRVFVANRKDRSISLVRVVTS